MILVVALIVLGPKRLPEAGRQVGKALAEVRRWSRDIQSEVKGAFDTETPAPKRKPTTPGAPPVAPKGTGAEEAFGPALPAPAVGEGVHEAPPSEPRAADAP